VMPVEPTDPIDPSEPTDPIDPSEPTDPIDPSEPTDPSNPTDPLVGFGDMFIVAHQDDDLLFMNPTLDVAIDGNGPVTTIYLTAGDAGRDEAYWAGREAGEKAAYSYMADSDVWVDEIVEVAANGTTFDVHSSYLDSQPDVRLYFLRIPDGFGDGSGSGSYGFQSLEQLADGDIDFVTTVDGNMTYTAEDVTAVLSSLMQTHTPDHVHIQDHTTEYADIEHSDHVTAAAFATEAVEDYNADLTVTSYVGYRSWGLEENLTPEQLEVVATTFDTYAEYDPQVFGSDGALIGAYEDWILREYVADEYTVSADPAAALQALTVPLDGPAFYEALMQPHSPAETDLQDPTTEEIDAELLI
jgi:LmbE family N-acetylglucosaminyl deacetylase